MLSREHEMVLTVAHAARRDVDRAHATAEVDANDFDKLLDFFRYFVNSCHGPKEEDLLFTALHRRGLAWDDYPLRDLRRQHEEMRLVLDSAFDWLPRVKAGDGRAVQPLLFDVVAFLDLLEQHVAEEEEAVFPLALRRLTPHDVEELTAAFAALACEELDGGVHAYYADMARHLAGAPA